MEIQGDLPHRFVECVCLPLVRPGVIPGLTDRFNPAMDVAGETVRLNPLGIAVFLVHELREPVASAKASALDIETAIDMLMRSC